MQIDIENLDVLVSQAGDIMLSPEAEDVLLKLLEIEEQVKEAIDQAKATLEQKALEKNPNFKSIQSDNIKVFYRAYGARFYVDESMLNEVPEHLYQTVVGAITPNADIEGLKNLFKDSGMKIRTDANGKMDISRVVDAKEVAKWEKVHHAFPAGIKEYERNNKISFSRKDKANAEDA